MHIIPRPPARHHLRYGLADHLLPCELLCRTPRHGSNPRVVVLRSLVTREYITRVETNMPESMRLGLIGRAISDVIEIDELVGSSWSGSRITLVEVKPISRIGPEPKSKSVPSARGFNAFIYSS